MKRFILISFVLLSLVSFGQNQTHKKFIPWLETDTAFVHQSIGTKQFVSGFLGSGWEISQDKNGNWEATFDKLNVRKTFSVYELLVKKIRSINGGLVVSAANGTIESVIDSTLKFGHWVIYQKDSVNGFVLGDIVRCQRFTGNNVRYYSAVVDYVASDNKYFTLQESSFDGTDRPAAGDEIVQFGNISDPERQGLIYLTSADDGSPYLDVLDGVNSSTYANKTKIRLGNLEGITDEVFGALGGYGLFGTNLYLRGTFADENGVLYSHKFAVTDSTFVSVINRTDTISTRLNDAETAISQNAEQILLRASKSSVDSLGQRVEDTEASINLQADQITLKVNNSDFNALSGRVSINESAINQTADQITLKASKSSVDSLGSRVSSAEQKITSDAIISTVSGTITQAKNDAISSAVSSIGNTKGVQLLPNTWNIGSGSVDVYQQSGQTVENARVYGLNHLNQTVILWECRTDGTNGPSGGWDSSPVNIDKSKTYRFSVFVKKNKNTGSVSMGCSNVCTLNTTTSYANPYFFSGNLPANNRWYLIVGFVYPYGTNGNINHVGGIYDCITGEKVADTNTEYNWDNVTQTVHRAYDYYDTDVSSRQWFWQPRVDMVDGNEPSIRDLIGAQSTYRNLMSQIPSHTELLTGGWVTLNTADGVTTKAHEIYNGNGSGAHRFDITYEKPLKTAGYVSVSFWYKHTAGTVINLDIQVNDKSVGTIYESSVENVWKKFEGMAYIDRLIGEYGFVDFEVNTGSTVGLKLLISDFQIERGSVVTAYKQASEDIQSTFKQTKDDITFGFQRIGVDGYSRTGKTVVDVNGLTVYDGGITIKNNAGTDVLYADGNGNLTLTGTINATSGSFTGNVNATSGSFTGNVNATSGSFTGNVNATSFTGNSGTIGGFTISGNGLTHTSGGSYIITRNSTSTKDARIGVETTPAYSYVQPVGYFRNTATDFAYVNTGIYAQGNSFSGFNNDLNSQLNASYAGVFNGNVAVVGGAITASVIIPYGEMYEMPNTDNQQLPSGYYLYVSNLFTANRNKYLPNPANYQRGETIRFCNWDDDDVNLFPLSGDYINGYTDRAVRLHNPGDYCLLRAERINNSSENNCWMVIGFGGTNIGIN